jgi:L-fuculose-phosphate aldolase
VSQFVVGAEGNVSKRVGSGFVVKASGCSLKQLRTKDLVVCQLDGKQLSNFKRRPSIEVSLHSWLYSNYDVNYIAHTHPTNTLKILCSDKAQIFANTRMFPDHVVYNGPKSCYIDYAHPGIDLLEKVKNGVEDFVNKEKYFPSLILLKNHGIICCGKTAKDCVYSSEICEKSAEIFTYSTTSTLTPLTNSDIEKLLKDDNEIYRKNLA